MARRGEIDFSPSRRRALSLLSGAAAVGMTASCGLLNGSDATGSSESKGGGNLEKPEIKLGLMPGIDFAPAFIALKDGFFEAEGLKVNNQMFQGGIQSIPALFSGSSDITFGNWPTIFQAQEQMGGSKSGIKIISDAYQAVPGSFMVMAKPDKGFTGMQDLVGKKIAINGRKNINELLMNSALEVTGVDRSGMQYVNMGFPDMPQALETDQVEAAIMIHPFIPVVERQLGAVSVVDLIDGPTQDMPVAGYITTPQFQEENPNTVAAFQRAMTRGQQAAQNRRRVEQILPEYVKVDPEALALSVIGEYPTTLSATRLERVATLMNRYQFLEAPVDVKSMIQPLPTN